MLGLRLAVVSLIAKNMLEVHRLSSFGAARGLPGPGIQTFSVLYIAK